MDKDKADKVIDSAMLKIGMNYDYPLIIQILAELWKIGRYNLNSRDKYICTELIRYAFQTAGLKLFKSGFKEIITPKDFLDPNCLLSMCQR